MQLSLFGAPPDAPPTQQAPLVAQQARPTAQQARQPNPQEAIAPRKSNIFDASPKRPDPPATLRERIERYIGAARAVATWEKATRRASFVLVPAPQEEGYREALARWTEAYQFEDMAWTCAQVMTHSATAWNTPPEQPPSLGREARDLAAQVLAQHAAHLPPIKTPDALAHLLHPLAPKPDGGRPREDLLDLREQMFRAWASAMHNPKLKAQGLDLFLERIALAVEGYDADERAEYGDLRHQHLRQVQRQPHTEVTP